MQDQLPHRALVLDLKNLIYIDSSGADTLLALVRACHKKQVRLIVCGLSHQPLDIVQRSGLLDVISSEDLAPDLAQGLARVTGR